MKTTIIKSDTDYQQAVNAPLNLYNYPVTITAKGVKYCLGVGNADVLRVKTKNGLVYIVGENKNLDYISLTIIDTETKQITERFFDDGYMAHEPFPFGLKRSIFDYSTSYQIRVLQKFI